MKIRLLNDEGAPYRQGMRKGEIYDAVEDLTMYRIGGNLYRRDRFESVIDSSTPTTLPGAVKVDREAIIEGRLVFETNCRDYDHFKSLPDVLSYKGVECVKTGWSSDKFYACYQQSEHVAHVVGG